MRITLSVTYDPHTAGIKTADDAKRLVQQQIASGALDLRGASVDAA